MTTKTPERRAMKRPVTIEERADGSRVISGYAAVFYNRSDAGTEYEMWDGCCERVDPGAFTRALNERQDVLCAFNHDDDAVLGRTSSGTCRLSVDPIGLRYEADVPPTSDGNDVATLIKRGDISGSSFSFIAKAVNWSTEPDGCEVRTLMDVDLIDVGPVTWPAYQATTTSARSEKAALDAEKAELAKKRQNEADAVDVAAKMARL